MAPEFPDPSTRNVLEPGCARCPALVESRERIAWGNGSLEAAIMLVGEAPGAGTPSADQWQGGNWTGMAYTARHSGRIIRTLFEEIGYSATELYVTNAVKCFPSDGAGSNREPTAEERRTCFDHLRTELEQVDPTVVVTTGKHATISMLEHEGIALDGFLDTVLDPIDCPTLGVTVLPLLHPSYQNVWLSRIGHDRDSYVDAIETTLTDLL